MVRADQSGMEVEVLQVKPPRLRIGLQRPFEHGKLIGSDRPVAYCGKKDSQIVLS